MSYSVRCTTALFTPLRARSCFLAPLADRGVFFRFVPRRPNADFWPTNARASSSPRLTSCLAPSAWGTVPSLVRRNEAWALREAPQGSRCVRPRSREVSRGLFLRSSVRQDARCWRLLFQSLGIGAIPAFVRVAFVERSAVRAGPFRGRGVPRRSGHRRVPPR